MYYYNFIRLNKLCDIPTRIYLMNCMSTLFLLSLHADIQLSVSV